MLFKHKSYKRIHTYDHESDVEKGKIKKETSNAKKHRKKQKKFLDVLLDDPDTLDDEAYEAYEASLHSEKKETGNAKAHKTRLKDLSDHDEID